MSVYSLLRVNEGDALALHRAYTAVDQAAMRNGTWDYADPAFICRRVVEELESLTFADYSEEERRWFQAILWFWHHHAISCAAGRYGDKAAAQSHAQFALQYQSSDHPNRITRLLFLLVYDRLEEAQKHASGIEDSVEHKTALTLLKEYMSEEWPLDKADSNSSPDA